MIQTFTYTSRCSFFIPCIECNVARVQTKIFRIFPALHKTLSRPVLNYPIHRHDIEDGSAVRTCLNIRGQISELPRSPHPPISQQKDFSQ